MMTPIQQQRLIGAALLLLLMAILAYAVLGQVGKHNTQRVMEVPEPIEFSSVIEPIEHGEMMVDADLQQTNAADKSAVAADEIEILTGQMESAPATEPPTAETPVKNITESIARTTDPLPTPPETLVSSPKSLDAIGSDSWLIQLGSFSVQTNAQSLKTQAEELGYKPYIENSQTEKGPIYRVRLPVMTSRVQADNAAARIQKVLNVKVQIIKQ